MANDIDTESSITQLITLQRGGGNTVRFGDLQLVPVGDGLLWVRPFYAQVSQSSSTDTVTIYRYVTVSYDRRAAWGSDLEEALAKLFPGYSGDLGDRVGEDGDGRRRRTPASPPSARPKRSWPGPTSCCAKPRRRSTTTATSATYQQKIDEAGQLIDEALAALQPADGTSTTVPPPTSTAAPSAGS